jgi:hypothetical protein
MHLAGCRACGAMHLCNNETCFTSRNSEGHNICHITGLCTKMLNFSDLEYIDTIQDMKIDRNPVNVRKVRASRKKRFRNITLCAHQKEPVRCKPDEKIYDMINMFVWEILCSEQWVRSTTLEYVRYKSKWVNSVIKVLREFKRKCPGQLPIIPDMYSGTIHMMCNTRVPPNVCIEDREILATWCSDNIRHHLMMLAGNFPDIIHASRLRGTVVGLMYLMRCGIIVRGIVVLPRLAILNTILPLETHLPHIFKIKGKVITETENTVKHVLKSFSVNELVVYGMPQNTTLPLNPKP